MKKIILAIAFIGALSAYSQTTLEEYNYMTSGFLIQLRTGQDFNKGYRMERLGKFAVEIPVASKGQRVSEFYAVYNENSTMPTEPIGTLLKMYRTDSFNEHLNNAYFFMPNKYSSSDVLTKAYDTYIKLFKSTTLSSTQPTQDYTWNMIRMISNLNTKK